jgi:hypothetical protein
LDRQAAEINASSYFTPLLTRLTFVFSNYFFLLSIG